MSGPALGNGPAVALPSPQVVNEPHVGHDRDKKRLRGAREEFDDLLGELGNLAGTMPRPTLLPVPPEQGPPTTSAREPSGVHVVPDKASSNRKDAGDKVFSDKASGHKALSDKASSEKLPSQRAPTASASTASAPTENAPGTRLRHPLAGQIEEMTVSVPKPSSPAAGAATHVSHRTDSPAADASSGGVGDRSGEGSQSLAARRSLSRVSAKPIDLQVDSSLMAMLQRPRGSAAEGAKEVSTQAPAPEPPPQPLPFDTPELGAGLAAHVSHLLAGGGHEALIRLAPDEFGMLEVRVTLHDGQVNVAFGAAVAQTRVALEQALPQLRDLLGAAGLRLNDASIVSQLARAVERPGGLPSRASIADVPGGNSEAAGRLSGSRRTKRTDVDLYV
jgi:flagellar hook-length control protein FliK